MSISDNARVASVAAHRWTPAAERPSQTTLATKTITEADGLPIHAARGTRGLRTALRLQDGCCRLRSAKRYS
jgi:hypothetical protein